MRTVTEGGGHRHGHEAGRVPPLRQEAGFSDVQVLPIDHPVYRFYRPVG